jgi:hypothetical protein
VHGWGGVRIGGHVRIGGAHTGGHAQVEGVHMDSRR